MVDPGQFYIRFKKVRHRFEFVFASNYPCLLAGNAVSVFVDLVKGYVSFDLDPLLTCNYNKSIMYHYLC